MDQKQGIPQDAPPPYPAAGGADQYNPGYSVNPGYPPQGQPGYPPQGQPGYPPQGYPPQGQPGYPPQGYPPQGDKGGYPTTGQPGYQQGYMQQPMPVAGAMTSTHNVTVVQTGGAIAVGIYPPDYCGLAWFACLCCCWPIGICAILSSNNARDAINRGDLGAAQSHSQAARKYSYMAIGFGIMLFILGIILRVVVFSAYYSTTTYN